MDVGVQVEVLAPGGQHGQEADLGTKVPEISRNRQQALRGGLEEHPVNPASILEGQGADLVRESKHHVEVFHGQELRRPLIKPLSAGGRLALGAMAVAARIVGDPAVAASVTLLDMPAQLRGAAASHMPEDTPLVRGEGISIPMEEGWGELPEDLSYFEPRSNHAVGSPFGDDTFTGLSAGSVEDTGWGLSLGSSRQSSGLRVAVTFAMDT